MKINYNYDQVNESYELQGSPRLLTPYWTLDAESYSKEAYRTEKCLEPSCPIWMFAYWMTIA